MCYVLKLHVNLNDVKIESLIEKMLTGCHIQQLLFAFVSSIPLQFASIDLFENYNFLKNGGYS